MDQLVLVKLKKKIKKINMLLNKMKFIIAQINKEFKVYKH